MKKGIEKGLVVFLFVLVLVLFSFAEKDSRKLDRLYKTAQPVRQNNPVPLVQLQPSTVRSLTN